ncbi:O-antigen ligase family protein [uncultured Meiothermus sp.]|uniref:O-antigen ligase family protein n=1 Tax=uncultured Meiothermus sp. TaxID=157471 RepID=UPI002607F8D5|nr:O-antigen ligase family protein [uncultured Meiothermus sp.]
MYLPKLLFLLVVGVLGLWEVRKQITKSVFLFLLLAHLLLVILSTLNARDETAFDLLGPSQRFDGILYHLGLFALGAFAYLSLRGAPLHFRPVALALVVGCGVQAAIVVLQRLDLDPVTPLRLWQDFNTPLGTLGHPGMVAALLLPGILVALWHGFADPRPGYRLLWLGAALFSAAGLGITGNSAAFYALVATLIAMNLWWRKWLLFLLSALLVVGVLVPRTVLPDPRSFEQDSQSYQDTHTLQTRLVIWQIALRAIQETPLQPVLGGGSDALKLAQIRNPPFDLLAEQYALEFGWPRDARLQDAYIKTFPGEDIKIRDRWIAFNFERFGGQQNVTKEFGFAIDRAHNFVLDRWLAFGLLSTLIWLVLYLYPVYLSLRNNHWLGWVFVALMIYYLAWFPVMQVEPIHLVLLAAAWALLPRVAKVPPPTTPT